MTTTTSWNDCLFEALKKVNRNLYGPVLPDAAREMLIRMEAAICSGDGLSPGSAFRTQDAAEMDRLLRMTGLQRSGTAVGPGGTCCINLELNPFGLTALYFA